MNACEHDSSSHLLYSELSARIIGAATQRLNEPRPGLGEMLYGNAQMIEPAEQELSVAQLKSIPVHYRSRFTGRLTPDLIH